MAALLFASCASVQIKDALFCADEGSLGASCAHTLTNETRKISKAQWDDIRFGQICEDASVFADWKAVIEKLCSFSNDCTYEQKQQIQAFFLKIEKLRQ